MAAHVYVPNTDDADADTDDDAGPCEDIVALAKTRSGASEDTYCGSDDDDDDDPHPHPHPTPRKNTKIYTKIKN